MKKALFVLLIAVFCLGKSTYAQIMVTFENNTSQYFTSTLLDNTWTGGTPTSYYIDVVNNQTQLRNAIVQTGNLLASTTAWRGIAFRTYPGGAPATIFPFTGMPYSGTFTAAGITYHLNCSILSPSHLYVRITP